MTVKLTHKDGDLIGPGQKKQYQILEKISSGGMGTVYKVRDTLTGNFHAVKECDVLDDPRRRQISRKQALELFRSEGARMERLKHSAIPRCFILRDAEVDLRVCLQCGNPISADLGTCGICNNAPSSMYYQGQKIEERCYLFMEYIEGQDIHHRCAHMPRPLSGDNLTTVQNQLAEIADVLAYLHAQQLVHRDIKPENIRISTDHDTVFLLDYGLLAEVPPPGKTKILATALGTTGYAPPDQAAGDITTALDSYAFAMTFLSLGSGLDPANPMDLAQLLNQAPADLIPEINPALAQIINAAKSQPAGRPQANAWSQALRARQTVPPPVQQVTPPPPPIPHAGNTPIPPQPQFQPKRHTQLKVSTLAQIAILFVVIALAAYTLAPGASSEAYAVTATNGAVVYEQINREGQRTQLKGGEQLMVRYESGNWLRVFKIDGTKTKGFIERSRIIRKRSDP